MGVYTNNPEGWGVGLQIIDMGGVDGALILEQSTSDTDFTLTSRNILVDPGGASASLTLPRADVLQGGPLYFINTADAAETLSLVDNVTIRAFIESEEGGMAVSNGTRWHVVMVGNGGL